MSEKKNPAGPVGEWAQREVARLRSAAGYSYIDLSDLVTREGRYIPPLGLSRLEKGERRIDVDDLVALAKVFNVHVTELLSPTDCPTCGNDPAPGFKCLTCGLSS